MNALGQNFASDAPEKREHSHMARCNLGDGRKQKNDNQECRNCQPQQAKYWVRIGVDNPAASFIEYRHNRSSPARL